ncbi:chloride channel protein [Chamaesiphon polymorphus]|uniref:Chloride channel protein n=1 Tax=Chamaesiphon polymorphus CCALA 037 TaxID=2107692 RepID=A0A2T1FSE5_9CYAN|nr:chloride channel protein [Chamaesiphon polymorphus]PSB47912.1 chloride channel protein [Chamaesiphon polymorphus CCALA 037]
MTVIPPSSVPPMAPILSRLTIKLNRLDRSPGLVVMLLSVLIGGTAGLGVILFHYLIDSFDSSSHALVVDNLKGLLHIQGNWLFALVPILGGIIVGIMRWYWQDFGPNMNSMIAATQEGRQVTPWRGLVKMVAASVSLGTGASLGPEGPSVEIGANLGMFLGQALHASQERQRLLLGAGAAAGIAAGFNAPIAGVFFALELVLGTTFATSAVSVVVLAAVVASLVAQIGLGARPAFALPVYEVKSLFELPLYLLLGGLASLVAFAYTQTVDFAREAFQGNVSSLAWLGKIPRCLTPVIGGAIVGIVALKFPQVTGIGYETIEAMLQDVQFSMVLLVSILAIKMLMTAVSLGSGLVGGLFAPSMFLGATLGAIYGKSLVLLFPSLVGLIAAPPAYAMVGMAAVLASSARAPLTSILLMFELTRDYRIVLPVMACVGLSIWAIERMNPKSKMPDKLDKLALSVQPDRDLDILQNLHVRDAMDTHYLRLSDRLDILAAGLKLTQNNCHSALVVDDRDKLLGIITLNDLSRAISQAEASLQSSRLSIDNVGSICTKHLLFADIDEPITAAIDRMNARGLHQLPVTDRTHPDTIVGILQQERIALACSVAATRQALSKYQLLLPKVAATVEQAV